MLIDKNHPGISIRRQCDLLSVPRSGCYYQKKGESHLNERLMRLTDDEYTRHPFYGSRRLTAWLKRQGYPVNRKRVIRLMKKMGTEAIYPKPRLSVSGAEHIRYPYLLKGSEINRPDQVWASDITYIRMKKGFVYPVVVMDWFSRFVPAFRVSISLDKKFCISCLRDSLGISKPEIFNTDQGARFTSNEFTERLKAENIAISMDGRGRASDNIFAERLWRTVKYEEVFLHDYQNVRDAEDRLRCYMRFYNEERLHQSLNYQTPMDVYFQRTGFSGVDKLSHS